MNQLSFLSIYINLASAIQIFRYFIYISNYKLIVLYLFTLYLYLLRERERKRDINILVLLNLFFDRWIDEKFQKSSFFLVFSSRFLCKVVLSYIHFLYVCKILLFRFFLKVTGEEKFFFFMLTFYSSKQLLIQFTH